MSKINVVIQKMQDAEYRTYFFRNSPKYQKLHLWLNPLYKKDYFNPKNIPYPIEDKRNKGSYSIPHWEVLDFLEAVAIQNRDEPKDKTTELLCSIVNNIVVSQSNKESRVDNYRVDWYMIKIIFLLPVEKITIDHIKFIGIAINETKFGHTLIDSDLGKIVLPVLIKNKMKKHLLELFPILFNYEFLEKKDALLSKRRTPILKEFWLNKILENHSKAIVNIAKIDGFIFLIKHLKKIIKQDEGSFNNVWIVAIEEHKQNSYSKYDYKIISMTRGFLEELNSNEVIGIIESLLKEQHPIFKRLAIHSLNYHYQELKDFFWQWFEDDRYEYNSTHKHELFKLFQDNSTKFSENEFKKIINWIESLEYSKYYEDRTPEQLKSITAYKRKEWLITIKEHNKMAQDLYDEYSNIAPEEIEHPGIGIWMSDFEWADKSPLKVNEQFCEKNVKEMVSHINTFNPDEVDEDPLMERKDWVEGLANEFGKCIQNNPEKFIGKLDLLCGLDKVYIYHVINSFGEAWKEKRTFDWSKLFNFIDKILDVTLLKSQDRYDVWIKHAISELIQIGTLNDNNAFNKKYMPLAKDVLFRLISIENDEDFESDNILNSSKGRAFEALMAYALRYGRLNSNDDVKWEKDIKMFFEEHLYKNKTDSNTIYTFALLGKYMTHIAFLDRQWLNEKFNDIFPLEKKDLWEISITNYFKYTSNIYANIYKLFKNNHHLEEIFNYSFKDKEKSIEEKAIQHICIAYMNKFDNETIFDKVKEKNIFYNLEVIDFIWRVYGNNPKYDKSMIYDLWEYLYETYKVIDNDAKNVFSHLAYWFSFIEDIDAIDMEWLKVSAKYADEFDYNSYFIVENLLRSIDKNPKRVGIIFLEMLEEKNYPTYKEEDIKEIVKNLFTKGEIENAKIICNKYAKKGIYFLNDIMRQYANN